jgi:hypothetical protein
MAHDYGKYDESDGAAAHCHNRHAESPHNDFIVSYFDVAHNRLQRFSLWKF